MSDYIKMNRRDWFKRAFSKTKEVSLKTTSRVAGDFAEVSDTLKEYRWDTVMPSRDLGDNPKQLLYQGKAVFILRDGQKVRALRGVCSVDKQLVFWQGHTKQFYCPHCETRYDMMGYAVKLDSDAKLHAYHVREQNDSIQIRAN